MREVFGADDAPQRFRQHRRRLRELLASALPPPGPNRARAIAETMPGRYVLPQTPRAAMPQIGWRCRPIIGVDAEAALSAIT